MANITLKIDGMTVTNLDSDVFWSPISGSPLVTSDTLYRYRSDLYTIEVTGTGLIYSGANSLPSGGTYSEIRAYTSVEFATALNLTGNFANFFSSGSIDVMIGADTLTAQYGYYAVLFGGGGADSMLGTICADIFRYLAPSDIASGEVINGDAGSDYIRLESSGRFDFSPVSISNVENLQFTVGGANAVVYGNQIGAGKIQTFHGSDGNDVLTIYTQGSANLSSLSFTNWTSGADGIQIWGTGQNDVLIGTSQDDVIYAIYRDDTVDGGAGSDTAAYNSPRNTVLIERIDAVGTTWRVTDTDDFTGGNEGVDTLTNIEKLYFGTGPSAVTLQIADLIGTLSDGDGTANIVNENASIGTPVGITALALDGNAEAVTYSLTSNAGGLFAIDAATGIVTVAGTLDFGTAASHGISVRATSADGSYTSKAFTIGVANVEGAPTDITISPSGFAENNSGTVVMTLAAVDSDPGNTFSYALVAGAGDTDNALFSVQGDLFIFGGTADHETQASYTVRLQVTDSTGFVYEAPKTIYVRNVNEQPTGINFSALSIDENNIYETEVAELSAIDPDIYDDYHYYELVAGEGDTDNNSFYFAGSFLYFSGQADFETKASYDIRVRMVNSGELSFETTKTLTVNNLTPEYLIGTPDDDTIAGGIDTDVISGVEGNDTLSGLDGNDELEGGDGNDFLNGGAGDDKMSGGVGDDTYEVNSVGDAAIELEGEGTDTINSSASFTLSSNVEILVLTGTSAINGTGNALDNILTGNDSNNILDGGVGNDSLIGGLGDDTYVLGDEADAVTEVAGQGIDTITSLIARSLADTAYLAIENLTLTGSSVINGTGNALANTLTGNAAANTLNGGTAVLTAWWAGLATTPTSPMAGIRL